MATDTAPRPRLSSIPLTEPRNLFTDSGTIVVRRHPHLLGVRFSMWHAEAKETLTVELHPDVFTKYAVAMGPGWFPTFGLSVILRDRDNPRDTRGHISYGSMRRNGSTIVVDCGTGSRFCVLSARPAEGK